MITIQINDAEVAAALGRAMGALADMTPVMQSIGEILVASTKARFAQGVAPDGTIWAPNTPVTLARKKGTKPLIGDQVLLSSQIFAEASANAVEVGSNRIQAAMMQFGGTTDQWPHLWGNIPARPFLGISDEDRGNILDEITEFLATTLAP
jgi:phage virion morphogenesis protein